MIGGPGILAVDIGGSKLAAGVVTPRGEVMLRDRVPTPARDPWPQLAGLIKRLRAAADDFTLVACGVACGGPMDLLAATVSPLNVPSWKEFALRDAVADLIGLPTFLDNGAKAQALAEGWVGSGVGLADFVFVAVGTGVGAGVVADGRLLSGGAGNAGHIGHVIVEPGGRPCRCGGRGCLETYLSAPAIEAETGRGAPFAPQMIIDRNGQYLGRALASVAAVLDTRTFLVGGVVADAWGEPFLERVRTEFDARSRLQFTRDADIRAARLAGSGALIGADAVALAQLPPELLMTSPA
ncbi:MAG: ROK family protein [Ilumatobacteraceae bacterium]